MGAAYAPHNDVLSRPNKRGTAIRRFHTNRDRTDRVADAVTFRANRIESYRPNKRYWCSELRFFPCRYQALRRNLLLYATAHRHPHWVYGLIIPLARLDETTFQGDVHECCHAPDVPK